MGGGAFAQGGAQDIGQWSSVYNLDQSLEEGTSYDEGLTGEIVHAALLPPSDRNDPATRVLVSCIPALQCSEGQKYGRAYLWKPSRPTVASPIEVPVTYPQSGTQDLFCGGHTFLADGSLLWSGGTNVVETCNPPDPNCLNIYGHEFAWRLITSTVSPTWVQAGTMPFARWYPTLTLMDTGNAAVHGHQFCPNEGQGNWRDEYQASTGSWQQAQANWEYVAGCPSPVEQALLGDYPRMHLLSNGQLFHTNAIGINPLTHEPVVRPSRFLDIGQQSWSCQPFGSAARRWKDGAEPQWVRLGGGSVHLITWTGTPGQLGAFTEVVYATGGSIVEPPDQTDPNCSIPYSYILQAVERLVNPTATDPVPSWSSMNPMLHSRANHNTVILLDGSILVVGGLGKAGGGLGCIGRHDAERYLPEEVFGVPDPYWTEMAEQVHDRLYHSIALLLPNGDVLSGGGFKPGDGPANLTSHSVEVYSPPYMFRGVRPVIVPALLEPAEDKDYGQVVTFDVLLANGAQLDRVALIRNGSTTHAFDMDQRYVELRLTQFPEVVSTGVWRVRVQMPEEPGFQAPPGFYMLTVVDTEQRPSEAEWIRLDHLPG